jgi:hypothetical protein
MHLICRDRLNLHAVEHPLYESGDWDVTPEDAQRLVGGMLYLHQTKAERSYFGGRVESFREVDVDAAHKRRIVFRLRSMREAKGVPWSGPDHPMAWTSGVLD